VLTPMDVTTIKRRVQANRRGLPRVFLFASRVNTTSETRGLDVRNQGQLSRPAWLGELSEGASTWEIAGGGDCLQTKHTHTPKPTQYEVHP
jgi:hypothetical protein